MSDTCGVEKCNDKKIKKWRARASHGRRYPLTSQAAIVHCAEYLGHLASRIFTLFMPFFAYFLYCQYFMFVDIEKDFVLKALIS